MKINEVKEQLQIDSANIRFYEKEGLIHPKRGANGYRDYDEIDIVRLKKIIIFRKIGMSISEIREVLDGYETLDNAIAKNIDNLNRKILELNGALEVSKMISKNISQEFDEEYYWGVIQEKEAAGEKFVKLIKEYWEFEKPFFVFRMTYDTFFDETGEVERSGVIISIIKMVLIVLLAGVMFFLFAKKGSVLGVISSGWFTALITVPVIGVLARIMYFAIQRKYGDVEAEEEVKEKSFLRSVLDIIGFILLILLLLLGAPYLLKECLIPMIMGRNVVYVLETSIFAYIIWLFASGVFLILFLYLYGEYGGDWTPGQSVGLQLHIPKKDKRKIVLYGVIGLLVVYICYATNVNIVTEDGAVKQSFFFQKKYTWEDVEYYTLKAESDGVLAYYVVMEDGARLKCLGGSISSSNFPEEKYPEGQEDYCRDLTKKFKGMGVELRVEDWEELYDKLSYDYWVEYAKELRELAE